MKKKIIKAMSVMMAVVLTLTAAPLSGFVGLELPEWLDFSIMSSAAETSGTCGTNLSWSYDSSAYTLTISGTGDMEDYSDDNRPWESYERHIKTIVIEDGVTSIGKLAFYSFDILSSVKIPDSIVAIGESAFSSCTSLTSVIIPDSITSLGKYTFSSCTSLKDVTIGEGITSITSYVFSDCTSLANVTIPNSVTMIDEYAFQHCGLTSIVIPDGVTSLVANAFKNCYLLETIIVGKNVEEINVNAFSGCNSILSYTVDKNNQYFSNDDYGVLFNKEKTEIIKYPVGSTYGTYTIPDSVTTIGKMAFYGCTSLLNVTIPDSVTTIDKMAFSCCTSLLSVTIPDSVITIGVSAFSSCTNMARIMLPDSLDSMGMNAFSNNNAEIYVESEDSLTAITLIEREIPFVIGNPGIEDSNNKYLNRDYTSYNSVLSSTSSSGLINLAIKYDFKSTVKDSVKNIKLNIFIPSTVTFTENSVRVDNVASNYTLNRGPLFIGNILTISLEDTSGVVQFSAKINDSSYFASYAEMEYSINGITKTETVGIINTTYDVFTINVPSETNKTEINVTGIAQPLETVTIYVNNKNMGSCVATKTGSYSKTISLEEPENNKLYTIKASVTDKNGVEKIVEDYVTYNEKTSKMISCIMYYNGNTYDLMNMNGSRPLISWSSNRSFTFKIKFDNSSNIENLYVVSTKGNDVRKIKATYDSRSDCFVASGFSNYVPGRISISYNAKDMEYVVDTNETIDFEKEYEDVPDVLKNSNIEIIENTTDDSDTGKFKAIVTPSEETGVKEIIYSIERNEPDKDISEKELKDNGYNKIKSNDGTYSYIKFKQHEESGLFSVDKWDFNDKGNIIFNTTCDLTLIGLDDASGSLSGFAATTGLIVDSVELCTQQMTTIDVKKKIMTLDISDAEKQARIALLDEINTNATQMKLLKMTSSAVFMVAGALLGPVGWATSLFMVGTAFINNLVWTNLDNNMDGMYLALIENLLNVDIRFAIDPSGFVYEGVAGNRLSDVKVTAFFKATKSDEPVLWDASEYEQMNPIYTDSDGCYAWDVPEGLWQVKYEKDGYETTYSEWLPVPPPQLEVNIGMNALSPPEVEYINVYKDKIEIGFTQYMNIDSINSSNVIFTSNGTSLTGTFEAVDLDYNNDKTAKYAKTFCFTPENEITNSVDATVSNVENYCSNKIATTYSKIHNVTLEIESLSVQETETAEYGTEKNITIQAFPAEAASGKTLNVALSNTYIAEPETTTLTFDENGKATLKLTTLLPGDVDIDFTIENTSLCAKTKLSVVMPEDTSVTGVLLDCYSLSLKKNDTKQLSATVLPSNAEEKTVSWHSSNEMVVTIDENGLVTAINPGNATISVTTRDGNYQAFCDIEVYIHKYKYNPVVTKPTCTEEGLTTYTCSLCGDTYTEVIPATGHNYESVVTNPTCTEGGYTTYTCACGDTYVGDEAEALGHTDGNAVEENYVAPTCTENGSKENVTYCTVCGTETSRETITISATDHIAGEIVIENVSDATCGQVGSYDEVVYCSVCGEEISRETKTVDKIPHSYTSKVTTLPTCTETGVETYTCTVCGDTYTKTVVATGHSLTYVEAKSPTCTETGYEAYEYCSVCDYTTFKEVSATGHNYDSVITSPSCTEGGYTTYTCSVCGDTYTSDEVNALGHTEAESVVENNVDSTCTTDGSYDSVVYCTVCNTEISRDTVIVDATGHNYVDGSCTSCGTSDPDYVPDEPEYNYTFGIQSPSRTEIRHKDGIKLHAKVEGTAPAGSYVVWTASNGKFKTEEINDGNSLQIISDKNGKTTFTATLYSADGEILATDTIEMKSKAGFFDKLGSFFRSLFGGTKIHEN